MSDEYQVYDELPWELREDGAYGDDEIPDAWCVLVEYANPAFRNDSLHGDAPTLVREEESNLGSEEDAEAAARRVAFEFSPPDPWSETGRTVYEVPGGYLSVLTGRVSTFHFRTTVGRCLGGS